MDNTKVPEPSFDENDWWCVVAPMANGEWSIISLSDAVSYNDMAALGNSSDDLKWIIGDWFDPNEQVCGIYKLQLKPWSYIETDAEYECGLDVVEAVLLAELDSKYFWKEVMSS